MLTPKNMASASLPEVSVLILAPCTADSIAALAERAGHAFRSTSYELLLLVETKTIAGKDHTKLTGPVMQTAKRPVKVVTYSGSLKAAASAGITQARGEVLAMVEGDPPACIDQIPVLLEEIHKGADIAIASRFIQGGGIEGLTRIKMGLSKMVAGIVRLLLPSRRRVHDLASPLYLVRKEALAAHLRGNGPSHLLPVLVEDRASEVCEVPYMEKRGQSRQCYGLGEEMRLIVQALLLAPKDREWRRAVKFALVGLSGVGVNMGTFWLMTRFVGLHDLAALILGYGTSILSNFTWNDLWTFRDLRTREKRATVLRAFKFSSVSLVAIGIYYSIYWPFTRILDVYDLLALATAIVAGVIWNFSMNVLWTWRRVPGKKISHT